MKKRLMTFLATGAFVGAMMAGGAGSALAGEVKGPPTGGPETTDYTAARENANSVCAYSGLNDNPGSTDPHNPGGRVQSYGYSAVRNGGKANVPSPGVACRGNQVQVPE
jgi:hypothetical protein